MKDKNKEMLTVGINKMTDVEEQVKLSIDNLVGVLGEVKAAIYALEKGSEDYI